jgi:hypothetical protein
VWSARTPVIKHGGGWCSAVFQTDRVTVSQTKLALYALWAEWLTMVQLNSFSAEHHEELEEDAETILSVQVKVNAPST